MLLYGLFVWLVTSWPSLIGSVLDGFMQVGVRAGGSTMSVSEFTNPSKIAGLGLVATEPIFLHIRDYGFFSGLKNIGDVLITGLCGIAIVAGFFVIAIQVFVLFLEFYVIAVCSLILVPFGVNQYTAWISEQTFGTLLGHGVKLMVLAFITSLAFPVLARLGLALPPDPTLKQILSMACGVWAITVLCLHAPRIAAGMLAGSPALTAGMAASTMVGGAVLAGMMGDAARQTSRSIGAGLKGATRLVGRSKPTGIGQVNVRKNP
jgi:type IV secretion system protein TrbL